MAESRWTEQEVRWIVVAAALKSISMALQLTPEQERRIQAVVSAGAYRSTEEALNAALAVVETAAVPDFEGTHDELETLLLEGLDSGEPIEADDTFWNRVTRETDRMAAEHGTRKPGY